MLLNDAHVLFIQYSCLHEYYMPRSPGGVADWLDCLCDSCQPYHALVFVNHPCALCGGTFIYFRDDAQTKLSEETAWDKLKHGIPLYSSRAEKEKLLGATEYRERIKALIERGMTLQAATVVIDAAMYGIGCIEGEVRARIEREKLCAINAEAKDAPNASPTQINQCTSTTPCAPEQPDAS